MSVHKTMAEYAALAITHKEHFALEVMAIQQQNKEIVEIFSGARRKILKPSLLLNLLDALEQQSEIFNQLVDNVVRHIADDTRMLETQLNYHTSEVVLEELLRDKAERAEQTGGESKPPHERQNHGHTN